MSGQQAADALRALSSDALAHFLAGRRWYGAKSAAPRHVRVHDAVPADDFAVARLDIELSDGRIERYQLPVGLASGDADVNAPRIDGDGALVDATYLPAFRTLLLRGLETGASYSAPDVRWTLRPREGADLAGLADLPARVGSAEQSNTSMLIGDRAILKLYRKLEAGEHPDVEIARFLTERTSFRNTPELLGTIVFEDHAGVETIAGMLQALVAGARDAWAEALDAACAYLASTAEEPPHPFADEMRELGRVTRALHDALASDHDDLAFAPKVATQTDVEEWAGRVRDLVRDSTALLAAARADGRLRAADAGVADAILRRAPEVLGDLDALAMEIDGRPGLRIRHHGDYHLGQVLKGADGRYMIIDFEGEPARLLAERRTPSSALRDVAGMLRSFAYAAASAAMERGGVGVDASVEGRSARWERGVRQAFLDGYTEQGAAEFLPAEPSVMTHLLTMFEMEKVFYELSYELNNRPDWVWIPLRGIGRLLGSASLPRRAP